MFVFQKMQFEILRVKANAKYYGLIGFENITNISEPLHEQYKRQIEFLANLSSVILERFRMEKMAEHLRINEEQNRIANEMHDNISQTLFSIVCSSHTLAKNSEKLSSLELIRQLQLLKSTANSAMEELRNCIFRLSSRKKGEQIFCLSLKKYLDDFSGLNNVKVKFEIKGNEEFLSGCIKNPLYRILCEACGNATRHGQCSEISVSLDMSDECTRLIICDDGKGFSVAEKMKGNTIGIGLLNMKNIVRSYHGDFKIRSAEGEGTEISIRIPVQALELSKSGGMDQ